jgi:hypothetical protein
MVRCAQRAGELRIAQFLLRRKLISLDPASRLVLCFQVTWVSVCLSHRPFSHRLKRLGNAVFETNLLAYERSELARTEPAQRRSIAWHLATIAAVVRVLYTQS